MGAGETMTAGRATIWRAAHERDLAREREARRARDDRAAWSEHNREADRARNGGPLACRAS